MKLNAREMKHLPDDEAEKLRKTVKRNPVYLVLEDIYDTYNVGGFFRLAEALAVKKVYLCGITETPPNSKVRRASMGAYNLVDWNYKDNAYEAIKELRSINGMQIIGVEQCRESKDYRDIEYRFPIGFVFGNETRGIKPETLKLVDAVAEIPMYGLNKSLNAMVAAGIVMYRAIGELKDV